MTLFNEAAATPAAAATAPGPPRPAGALPTADIDFALTAQLVVAFAGESGGEPPRLGWWRSDLTSEYGGADLFRRLLPHTWPFAVLEGAREAARRVDAARRAQAADADRIVSLFALGFEVDERLAARLYELKQAGGPPAAALPGLAPLDAPFDRERFFAWVAGHGPGEATPSPLGRRLKGAPPATLRETVAALVAALAPPAADYPLPHFRRDA